VLLDIIGKEWYMMFLLLIPIVNIVFAIRGVNGVSKAFGKGAGFTAGLILLGFIFWPMLGFGSAEYTKPA
jgi:arginine exporter protein ArgO